MKAVLQDASVPGVDVLIKRVEDAARDSRKTDLCLGMVDLWRRNIVIDSDMNICLLDWELVGWSNAKCEMSLLGVFAFFYLFIYLFSFNTFLFSLTKTVHTMHWILLRPSFTDAAKNRTNLFISTMLQNYGQVRSDVPSPHHIRQALIFLWSQDYQLSEMALECR